MTSLAKVALTALLVPLHVKCQMVRSGEAPIAVAAFERLEAGVLAMVSGQLIGPREPPLTTFPGTAVRLLSYYIG